MADLGSTTRFLNRSRSTFPAVDAGGPTGVLPSSAHGQYGQIAYGKVGSDGDVLIKTMRRLHPSPPISAGGIPSIPSANVGTYASDQVASMLAGDAGLNYNRSYNLFWPSGSVAVVYKMVGTDHTLTTTDSWLVTGSPDFTGAFYAGALATPLRFIHIS